MTQRPALLPALIAPLLGLLLTGCSTTITNLTPREQTRNANGLYPFEIQWNSRQQSIHPETIRPLVVIGTETFAMQPESGIPNRWEAIVPIAASTDYVNYRFKVDYEYNAIPVRRQGSKLSEPYQMHIVPPGQSPAH